MKRIMKMISVFFIFVIFVNLNLWSEGKVLKQKISLKGEPLISSFLKKEIATVVFSAPQGGLLYTYRGLISGFNHDLTGRRLKGNEITAIKYTQKGKVITRGTRLEGKEKLGKVISLSLKKDIIDLLKKNADVVIDKDTTYGEEGNIGDVDNPKIVVVKNARLTLKKNFKGYGVLIFTGNTGPFYRLYMYDNATWYGLVISDSNRIGFYLRGKIAPVYIRGKRAYGNNRCEFYRIKMLKYKALYERYKKSYEKYCKKTSSLYEKRKLFNWRCRLYEIYKRLYEKYKKLYEECSGKPEISNPSILGAVLLEGKKDYLYLYQAKILYCQEAVEEEICKKLIEKKIATHQILPLKLEEYKEEE